MQANTCRFINGKITAFSLLKPVDKDADIGLFFLAVSISYAPLCEGLLLPLLMSLPQYLHVSIFAFSCDSTFSTTIPTSPAARHGSTGEKKDTNTIMKR
jgi:hypothetical protein